MNGWTLDQTAEVEQEKKRETDVRSVSSRSRVPSVPKRFLSLSDLVLALSKQENMQIHHSKTWR